MRQRAQQPFIILTGKNPLESGGGREAYAMTLATILHKLRYRVIIICNDKKTKTYTTSFGSIITIGSWVFRVPFVRSIPMTWLPLLAFSNAFAIKRLLASMNISPHQRLRIWGMGPWTLAANILNHISPHAFTIIADYCTTIKHEIDRTRSGVSIGWYPVSFRLTVFLFRILCVPFFHLLEKIIISLSHAVVVQYRSSARILTNEFGIDRKRLRHLPFPSLPQIIKNADDVLLPTDRPVIFLLARQDARKGIPFLLQAFALLQAENIPFMGIIGGDGPLLAYHTSFARRLGLTNVFFPGTIPNPVPFLKRAALYVFPSLEEGGGALSLLEAMQYSLPIVSTNIDGVPEDISDCKEGLLVPPANPQALAYAMKQLLRSPRLARRLGKNAQIRFYKDHGTKHVQASLKKFLSTLP